MPNQQFLVDGAFLDANYGGVAPADAAAIEPAAVVVINEQEPEAGELEVHVQAAPVDQHQTPLRALANAIVDHIEAVGLQGSWRAFLALATVTTGMVLKATVETYYESEAQEGQFLPNLAENAMNLLIASATWKAQRLVYAA